MLIFNVNSESEIRLPFWGKVIDVASLRDIAGNSNFLDLGYVGGEEDLDDENEDLDVQLDRQRLALDGNTYMNCQASDCCLAWFARVQTQPGAKDKATDATTKGSKPIRKTTSTKSGKAKKASET